MPRLRVRVQTDFEAAADIAVCGILLFSQTLLFSRAIRQSKLNGTAETYFRNSHSIEITNNSRANVIYSELRIERN